MIGFGNDNSECNCPPLLVSCCEITDDENRFNILELVVNTDKDKKYKITFEDYMMHLTRNELYTAWDDYEIRNGNYFILFAKSRLLDVVNDMIIHTEDHSWPGKGKHYGVYTCNHIIDIISANEPCIIELPE